MSAQFQVISCFEEGRVKKMKMKEQGGKKIDRQKSLLEKLNYHALFLTSCDQQNHQRDAMTQLQATQREASWIISL